MNNTLYFNRLGKVIRRDGMNFSQNIGWTMIILWAIPVLFWLVSFIIVGEGNESTARVEKLKILELIALIVAPAKLYCDCNDPRKGIQYAMMPASALEKFISMFFYCTIVTPIIYWAGAILTDTLLASLPGRNPYNGFIFAKLLNPIYQSTEFSQAAVIQNTDFDYESFVYEASGLFNGLTLISIKITSILATVSVFMFGNMFFKNRKTLKTIGAVILLFIILMIVFIKFIINLAPSIPEDEEMAARMIIDIMKNSIYICTIASFVFSIVLFTLTYFKIKTQKY